MPYVRTVKTASGATPVQIVYSSRRGSRDIEHIDEVFAQPVLARTGRGRHISFPRCAQRVVRSKA